MKRLELTDEQLRLLIDAVSNYADASFDDSISDARSKIHYDKLLELEKILDKA